jgi:GT2 family glycosyltransferase
MPTHKIAVGMITGDHKAHLGVLTSFMQMNRKDDFDFTLVHERGLYLDKSRNVVAAWFEMKTDCDYLWFLDSDNGFDPDAPTQFMETFEDPEVNIVSGAYHYKTGARDLVAGVSNELCLDGFYSMLPEGAFLDHLINLSRVGKGAMVGTGCLMMRRRVFEEVPYPWFQTPWRQYEDGGWALTGEDTFFCERVQEYGFDIHLDQRIKSPHYAGAKCYPDEWDQFKEKED